MFLKDILIKKSKILGRGENSGHGKTSGRGNKGQKSRSGKKISPDFEGGQTKFFKNLPKFGFKRKKNNCSLNLLKINKIPISLISYKYLKIFKIFKKVVSGVKIFSLFFFLKKMIFYNVFFSKLKNFFFISLNCFFIF